MAGRRGAQEVVVTLRPHGREHRGGINSLGLAEGGLLYSAGRDGVCRVWDVATKGVAPTHVTSLVGHSDWVNDVVVSGDDLVVTCSSDQTVMLWGGTRRNHERLGTLTGHADYVKAIAYSAATHRLATCSLDQSILLWDLQAAQPAASKRPSRPVRMEGPSNSSYYDVALDAAGRLVASASTDGMVRIWDSRSAAHVCRLQGHEGPVRCVQIDRDGAVVVSGSSDNTVRVWDVGQQRCVHVCEPHSDSVWAMTPRGTNGAAGFCEMLTAGRDGSVCSIDVRSGTSGSVLPAAAVVSGQGDAAATSTNASSIPAAAVKAGTGRLHAPLSLAVSESGGSATVWIATTTSDLNEFVLGTRESGSGSDTTTYGGDSGDLERHSGSVGVPLPRGATTSPYTSEVAATSAGALPQPQRRIHGLPGIIRHAVLNNRRHVLTQDDTGMLEVWDVTRGRQLESLGRVPFCDFDTQAAKLSDDDKVQVPSWFSAETKLGSLAIHLKAPQCFETVVYACDAGLVTDGTDGSKEALDLTSEVKVNLGSHMLRSLFVAAKQTQPRASVPNVHVPLAAECDGQDREHDRQNANTDGRSSGARSDHQREVLPSKDHTSTHLAQEAQDSTGATADPDNTQVEDEGPMIDPSTQLQLYPLPADLSLLITEQRERAGSPRVTFRTTLGSISPADQQAMPAWVFDTVVRGREFSRDLPKLNFLLRPHESVSGTSPFGQMEPQKLSAPRLLRVHKIINHVEAKLREELAKASNDEGSTKQCTEVEVVCNDVVLPTNTNLGECAGPESTDLVDRLTSFSQPSPLPKLHNSNFTNITYTRYPKVSSVIGHQCSCHSERHDFLSLFCTCRDSTSLLLEKSFGPGALFQTCG